MKMKMKITSVNEFNKIYEENVSSDIASTNVKLNKDCECGKIPCECVNESYPTMVGTYVAVKWPEDLGKQMIRYWSDIPNLVPADSLHSTLAYSKVEFDHTITNEEFTGSFKNFRIFNDKRTKKDVLVIELDSPELIKRHEQIHKDNPEAIYDFDKYIPHITLSYDVSSMEKSELDYLLNLGYGKEIRDEQFESFNGAKEYTETLDLNK